MLLFERRRWLIWFPLALAATAIALFVERSHRPFVAPQAVGPVQPATHAAATTQSAAPATAPAAAQTLLDVIHRDHPDYPATQPLPPQQALSFAECGHFVLHQPVFLDAAGNLWITHPDADDTAAVLKRAQDQTTHVTRERVLFVHRLRNADDSWRTMLICQTPDGQGFVAVDADSRSPLATQGSGYEWGRAFSWKNKIVVPTQAGLSIWNFEKGAVEQPSPPLAQGDAPHRGVQMVEDIDEVFAWIPPGSSTPGSRGAVRFDAHSWQILGPQQNWPEAIVDLVPLSDGSVLQLVKDDAPDNQDQAGSANPMQVGDIPQEAPMARGIKVKPHLVLLSPAHVDEAKAMTYIRDLSADSPDKRRAAYAELTHFGSPIRPILQRELPNAESAEATQAIQRLLHAQIAATLGGMTLVDGHVRCLVHQSNGIALYYVDGGVSCPQAQGEDRVVVPAYLSHPSLQPTNDWPGALYGTLSEALAQKINPDKFSFTLVENEWIFGDPSTGPLRYSGNGFFPLLSGSETAFCRVVGKDALGRWLFRKPLSPQDSATQSATPPDEPETLIVDPRLPDATPRLPIWNVVMGQAHTGWSADDWPALKNVGAWVLQETQWQTLDLDKQKMFTEQPATSHAASTAPATTLPAPPPGAAILVDPQGNKYYGGQRSLIVVDSHARRIEWPLPDQAVGIGQINLIQTSDGRLYLFNQPGRVVRIAPTPLKSEPFTVEAVFSKHLPDAEHPRRIWLDHAGRIDIVYGDDGLSILFPSGHIPEDIEKLMPGSALQGDEP